MEIPLILSGNFGELRSNHFHSGLDIKTQQREGIPVYATADGYVSRINVSHWGYGKAVYLQHPNGYTTVYAHLQNYAGSLQTYVKNLQYRRETYEIEVFPKPDELPVKKGDLIGYSGNSGSSGGPHLHYEIRDHAQRPMNPMLFGTQIPDSRSPVVQAVYAYPVGDDSQVNQSGNRTKLRLIRQQNGDYKAETITASGTIGIGITAHDLLDGASNPNGIYSIRTHLNNMEKFHVRFDKFSFAETRFLNLYIDYDYFRSSRSRIQKLYRDAGNPLSVIVDEKDDGLLSVEDGLHYMYSILITDFSGNTRSVLIPIEGKKQEVTDPRLPESGSDFVYASHATSLTKGNFSIYLPANTLYKDTYLTVQANGDTLQLDRDRIPVHRSISITADISRYRENDREKLFIGRLVPRGKPQYVTTKRQGDKLTATTRLFGDYAVLPDLTPPTVRPHNFSDGQWISGHNTLQVRIEDDLSGISSYRATINDQFILMEYEPKKNLLTYDFSDRIISETENNLKIIVIDNVGNSTTFEAKFFRKQS